MVSEIFFEISILIVMATLMAMIMRAFRQPLIIGHILTGVLVGPAVFGLMDDPHTIEILGKFGIALLLFIVGLGLNPRIIKELGKVAVITGVGQVASTTVIGFGVLKLMGFGNSTAVFVAIGLAFSSTIVILKLLSDKKEQNTLYGKISIGFLLVQDIIATFALVIATATSAGGLSISQVGWLMAKGALAVIGILLAVKFIIKPMNHFLTKSQELLFLFSLAWGFGIGALFLKLGFSLEVGALFAGVALASMQYAQDMSSRLRPLRDFFVVIFFIALGASLELGSIGSVWWQAVLLSAFVLIGNPIIVLTLLGMLGYTKKTAFKTSLAVAQVSEFSIIFVLLGKDNGQTTDTAMALITMVALITFALSSYMIIYADKLFDFFDKYLSVFERTNTKSDRDHSVQYEAIIFGFKKGGAEFARTFAQQKKKFLVIDYDPDVIDEVSRRGYDSLYGDATDPELLEESGIDRVKSVISTITEHDVTEFIIKTTIHANPKAIIICSADSAKNATRLYELGATYVMLPHTIGTERISNFIAKHGFKKSEFKTFRDKHLLYLATYIDDLPEKHSRKLGHAVIERLAELSAMTSAKK
jgi:Kef-type K+ transport system membrane component KefB/Trk K+ transport system NAD-binding subunit